MIDHIPLRPVRRSEKENETLCTPCKKAAGAVVECEMCGTPCDESRMSEEISEDILPLAAETGDQAWEEEP